MKRLILAISLAVVYLLSVFVGRGSAGDNAKMEELAKRLDAMQKQLDEVQAVEEIEKLQTQYLDYVIYNKLDEVGTLFSENGVLDVFQEKQPAKGAKEITAIFQERKAMIAEDVKKGNHAIMFDVHPIITVEGDKAKSNFLLFNIMPMGDQSFGIQQGSYNLEFIKEKGKWKISYLKYTREFSIGSGNPAMGRGPGSAVGTSAK